MDKLDCVVIGAGVLGLSVARAMAVEGREVFILESTEGIGNEASSRNSEVIHAGIYYPTGSLKARSSVRGRDLLYGYCEEKGIRHRRIGKLIVAGDEAEVSRLRELEAQGRANGVSDLTWLGRAEAVSMEPALRCEAALLSPSTGIVDSHRLMEALLRDAEENGALIALGSPVLGGLIRDDGIALEVAGPEPMTALCRTVINCTGIHASRVARSLRPFPERSLPGTYMCKGSYFSLPGPAPFSRLIYPVPDAASLGIHLTLDLAGRARFGPDTEWVDEIDYRVDERRAESFYPAIRRYWPDLPDGALLPDYSGIRARIVGPGEDPGDFLVQGPEEHGIPGLVNLFGIDSPGLTASLALAEEVVRVLK